MANDPLKYQRNQLTAAETSLTAARGSLRTAVERQGLSTAGIFSETEFVPRATAERWAREAKLKGREEGANSLVRAFESLRDAGLITVAVHKSSAKSPFAHLGRMDIHEAESAADQMFAELLKAGKKARGES
jgi:hypothetical protein